MSLLSDALKRHQQERGDDTAFPRVSGSEQNAPPEQQAQDVAPPPLPAAPVKKAPVTDQRQAAPSREWAAKVLVGAGILVVLIGLGLPYYYFVVREPFEPGVDDAPVVEQAVVLMEPEPEPMTEPPPVEEAVPPAEDPVEDEIASPEPADRLPAEVPVAETRPTSEPEPEPASVPWPDMRVQAAMGSGDSGSVLINGEITPVGERYQDVLIREITPQGVLLEYQGEERVVRVRR